MITKSELTITGAYPNKGTFKNSDGETIDYDYCKFYVEMPLKQGKGVSTAEFKAFTASEFDTIFNVDLPAKAEISFERVVNNGKSVETIVAIDFKSKPHNSKVAP